MSQVLIISKTNLQHAMCIGGLELNTNRSIRLMSHGEYSYQPIDTPFNVGQVWELSFHNHQHIQTPHIEDVIVTSKRYLREQGNLSQFINQRNLINYHGHVNNVFSGLLHWTNNGSAYIPANGPYPDRSVGFWLNDRDVNRRDYKNKVRYGYPNGQAYRSLSYVGTQNPINKIDAGTIIRVSLSRIFPRLGQENQFNVPQGYYLQLSGWYESGVTQVADDLPF